MAFPSVLSTISNPTPTNKLNSPSHSGIETAQNTAIGEIENFVGTLSSVQGTLLYDIRSQNSNGGGHIQTADHGGTGQTSFNKGDILVGQSSSVLTKLAVGADGKAIVADSTSQTGLSYQGVITAPAIQNQTYTYAKASVISSSVYGVILQNTPSVISGGMGLVVQFPTAAATSLIALQVYTSAGSVAALIKYPDLTLPNPSNITASMLGIVEFDSVSSVFQLMNVASPVSKADVNKKQGVFPSSYTSRAGGSTFQALNDGFFFGNYQGGGGTQPTVVSDSQSSPASVIATLGATNGNPFNFMVPIISQNYYKFIQQSSTGVTLFFIGFSN